MSTRNKIIFSVALLLVVIVLLITKCTKTISYTYNVETGDKIKITFTTGNGYKISDSSPFEITKNGKTLTQGIFISEDGYEQYIATIPTDEKAKVIETKKKGDIEYTFYSYDNSEWNYVIKVNDSKTGLLLGNAESEKSARECFDRLEIKKK